jgi:hypothetical protein
MKFSIAIAYACLASQAPAAVLALNLEGKAGVGLLAGNDVGNPQGAPGIGDELGSGITFDTEARVLSVQIAWTGLQGLTDGTFGVATGARIHGPVAGNPLLGAGTAAVNFLTGVGSADFTAPQFSVANLPDGSGAVSGAVTLSPAAASALLEGRYYITIRSARNPLGELRGNIVPEPSAAALALAALGVVALRRERLTHLF